MATIRTAIQIQDGMSRVFRGMNKALNIVINSFESLQNASHNAVDINSIQAARRELNSAEIAFDRIEQNINQAGLQQQKFNQQINNGTNAGGNLLRKIKSILGVYVGVNAVKGIFNLSDTLTQTTSRLNLMNDGLQSTEELQNKIFASANRSRSVYTDTASAVSKLGILAGSAFKNNDEIIAFTELLNKNFVIGGASAEEMSSAMYQLTQSMASGRLQGDEFRSITENAPLILTALKEYTGKSSAELKQMSADGEISAELIKNAMFAASDEINSKFEEMPKTISQVWTSIKNKAIKAFEPILTKINEITNSNKFQRFVTGFTNGIAGIANVTANLFDILLGVTNLISNNWGWIEPIVWGIVTAFFAFNSAMLIYNTLTSIGAGLTAFHAAQLAWKSKTSLADVAATELATGAQIGFNAALLACPLTWIIGIIVLLIALFYATIGVINQLTGTTVSATGIILGVLNAALAIVENAFGSIWNVLSGIFIEIWNLILTFAEFFANVFNDPIGSIVRLFAGLLDYIISVLQSAASLIDTIFGSNLSKGIQGWRDSISNGVTDLVGEAKIKYDRVNPDDYKYKRTDISDSFDYGYNYGKNLENSFNLSNFMNSNMPDYNDLLNGIATDTNSISDSVSASDEDLQYLRDLAEQEVVNRFTTAEIKVDMGGINNNVSQNTDLDGMVAYLAESLTNTMSIAAEGVHS